MLFKKLSLMVVALFVLTYGTSFALEINITENFNGYILTGENTVATELILEDTIINTTTGEKTYIKDQLISNDSTAKVITKTLKLDTLPTIMEYGPLGERQGVFYTGKSIVLTKGISEWYHFSGVMFDLDVPCDTLAMTFSYLNNKNSQTGKVKIIIQEVDPSNNVIWESVWGITGYKTYIDGWEDMDLPASRFEPRLAGRTFNRVWLIETELYLDITSGQNSGGYFDSVSIKATSIIEELPQEEPMDKDITPPVEEPEIDPELLTDDVIDTILTDDITVSNELLELLAISENTCPASNGWKNHGKYVKCVTKLKKELKGDFSAQSLKDMKKIAAKSNIGKRSIKTNKKIKRCSRKNIRKQIKN